MCWNNLRDKVNSKLYLHNLHNHQGAALVPIAPSVDVVPRCSGQSHHVWSLGFFGRFTNPFGVKKIGSASNIPRWNLGGDRSGIGRSVSWICSYHFKVVVGSGFYKLRGPRHNCKFQGVGSSNPQRAVPRFVPQLPKIASSPLIKRRCWKSTFLPFWNCPFQQICKFSRMFYQNLEGLIATGRPGHVEPSGFKKTKSLTHWQCWMFDSCCILLMVISYWLRAEASLFLPSAFPPSQTAAVYHYTSEVSWRFTAKAGPADPPLQQKLPGPKIKRKVPVSVNQFFSCWGWPIPTEESGEI